LKNFQISISTHCFLVNIYCFHPQSFLIFGLILLFTVVIL
jgi:hypothetical protein